MNLKRTYSVQRVVKWLGIVFILLAYLAMSGLASIVPATTRNRRIMRVRTTSFFSKLALSVFRVRIHVKYGELFQSLPGGRLIISNHLSYIDILVISALLPAAFITSVELKNTPLLGLLARFGGSLFVERRSGSRLKQEIKDIAKVLGEGFCVVLFPEGTTSNGDRVREFKNSLFDSAVSSGAAILPVCLRYTAINGKPLSPANRDSLFFYGGIPFSKHFPRFLSLGSVQLEVTHIKGIRPRAETTRKELAAWANAAISADYSAPDAD